MRTKTYETLTPTLTLALRKAMKDPLKVVVGEDGVRYSERGYRLGSAKEIASMHADNLAAALNARKAAVGGARVRVPNRATARMRDIAGPCLALNTHFPRHAPCTCPVARCEPLPPRQQRGRQGGGTRRAQMEEAGGARVRARVPGRARALSYMTISGYNA